MESYLTLVPVVDQLDMNYKLLVNLPVQEVVMIKWDVNIRPGHQCSWMKRGWALRPFNMRPWRQTALSYPMP